MSKKNLLAAAALSTALGTAHATPPKDGKCADNQTATVSAIHGVIDCQDQRATGLPETFSPRSESRAPLVETTLGGGNSKFGSYAQGGAQLNFGRASLAVNGIVGKDELRALVTAGLQVTPELALIAWVGWAREDAGKAFGNEKYSGKDIKGESAYIRAEYALPRDSVVARAFLEYMRAKGETTLLDTTYAHSVDIRTEEFRAFVRTISTSHVDTTRTSFHGDKKKTFRGGATLHIGQNGELTLTVGAMKDRDGNKAVGGVKYEQFQGDSKWSLQALALSWSYSLGARYETRIRENLSGYVEASGTKIPGVGKNDNRIGVGISYALGATPRYTRAERGTVDVASSVRTLAPDHSTHGVGSVAILGEVVSVTTRQSTEKVSDAAKMPESVNVKNVKINPDGSVTVNFDQMSPWVYECMIDGKNIISCTSPWTSPVLTPGGHTLSIRSVNNAIKWDLQKSPWTDVKTNIFTDTASLSAAPVIQSIGFTNVKFSYRISDPDGVRNQKCSVGTETITPDKDGNCSFDRLTPGTRYDAITTAEVARKLPDGSLVWEGVRISTPFTTDIASDSPTVVTLDVTNITTTSLLARCGISDSDGASGTCTLRDANNTVVTSWTIGADRPITGLTPSTTYTLALVGTANRRNPDNTLSTVGVNRLVVVTTLAPTVTVPPAPVLSASVSGSTVSLTCPAVAGATGYDFYQWSTLLGSSTTCSYTVSGLADGSYTFTAKAKNSAGSSVASNSQTVNILNIPTWPALANVWPLLDHGGNPITFNLNALIGLPAGSQVVGVIGFPALDDIGQPTNLSCSSSGSCTVVYDVGTAGTPIGFQKTFPVTVKVRVPGYTPTLDRTLNIIIENEA